MRTILFCAVALSLVAGSVRLADAGARRSRPLKTGQTSCFNVTGDIVSCAGTTQDGALRRGEPRSYQDNGDGTIRDKRTALTWEKLSDDGTIHDRDTTYTWSDAFGKIDALNTPPCFAGFCDWRLPNAFELYTLVDLESFSPAISAVFVTGCSPGCSVLGCSCTTAGGYWTSSTSSANGHDAWAVRFSFGAIVDDFKSNFNHARGVRGGS